MAKFKVRAKQVLYAVAIVEAENKDDAFEIVSENWGKYLPQKNFASSEREIQDIIKIAE